MKPQATSAQPPKPQTCELPATLCGPGWEALTLQVIYMYKDCSAFLASISSDRHLSSGSIHYTNCTTITDSVLGLARSSESRKVLFKLAFELGVADDPRWQNALHSDSHHIFEHVVAVIQSTEAREAVLKLEGDNAQQFFEVVTNTLQGNPALTPEVCPRAERLIDDIYEAWYKIAPGTFVGITHRDRDPTFGGGYADIFRGERGGKGVGLKRLRVLQGENAHPMRLKFCQEALLWLKLDHPHILPLIGIYREPLTELSSSLFMVSPWMGEGTVLTHLKDVGMADVNRLLLQIAQGLQYLHSQGIVHGDLRGRNILITTDWTVRLIDFGLSRSFDASRRTSKEGGSLRWMAPELIDPEEFGLQFRPTPATDVYAFGCVCVELYTGQPPFSHIPMDASDYAIVRCVMDGERPERPTEEPLMTDRFWNCVTTYWGQNYTIRPSAEVIVSDMTGVAVESSGPSDEMVSDPTPSLSQKAPTMTLAACVETFFMPQLDSEAKDNVQRIPAAEGSTALLAAVA